MTLTNFFNQRVREIDELYEIILAREHKNFVHSVIAFIVLALLTIGMVIAFIIDDPTRLDDGRWLGFSIAEGIFLLIALLIPLLCAVDYRDYQRCRDASIAIKANQNITHFTNIATRLARNAYPQIQYSVIEVKYDVAKGRWRYLLEPITFTDADQYICELTERCRLGDVFCTTNYEIVVRDDTFNVSLDEPTWIIKTSQLTD